MDGYTIHLYVFLLFNYAKMSTFRFKRNIWRKILISLTPYPLLLRCDHVNKRNQLGSLWEEGFVRKRHHVD